MIPLAALSAVPWRAVGLGLACAAVVAAGAWAMRQHDRAVTAERVAEEQAAQLDQIQTDHARQVAALELQAAASAARAASSATTKGRIYAAPPSSACADSAAVRAALDGLRQRAAGGGKAARGS